MKTLICALIVSATLSASAVPTHAQTSPTGQLPGSQNTQNPNKGSATPGCADTSGLPTSSATAEAGCNQLAPGFVNPSTNMPPGEHRVVAVTRVEAVVEKPAKLPFPMDFNVVGKNTMVSAKMPRLNSCFMSGQVLSNRSGAATSTTCLDLKGVVLAYEECTPKSGDMPMACSTVITKDGDTVASAR